MNLTELCLPYFYQSFSPQMIILRVAMGHGWLKETANEFNTAPVFAKPIMVHGQGRAVFVTTHNMIESPIYGPGMSAESLDTSV